MGTAHPTYLKYSFAHHFLPHPEYKTRAKFLSLRYLMAYSFLLAVFSVSTRIVSFVAPGVLGYASNISSGDLLDLTNSRREKAGLEDLTINSALSAAARKKAEHMFKNNYWAHVSPDGTQPWDFIIAENYDYSYAGENLAKNFKTSDQVVEAWYESPSHRDNLLNSKYTEVGFAVVNGTLDGYDTTLVVQMFGKPRASLAAVTTPKKESSQPLVVKEETPQTPEVLQKAVVNMNPSPTQLVQTIDVPTISKYLTFAALGFVMGLLMLDIWYSSRKGIVRITGHSFAHIVLLFFFAGIVWTMSPGRIM